jgi:hypothetical protein
MNSVQPRPNINPSIDLNTLPAMVQSTLPEMLQSEFVDPYSSKAVRAMLAKNGIEIPPNGWPYPHFRIRVPKNVHKVIGEAIRIFHEILINQDSLLRNVFKYLDSIGTPLDKKLYLYYASEDTVMKSLFCYLGAWNIPNFENLKKKFFTYEVLLNFLASKFKTNAFNMKLIVYKEYADLKVSRKVPLGKFGDVFCHTMRDPKSNKPPKARNRKGKLDRLAKKLKGKDGTKVLEETKDLSKDSRKRLRKKGVKIPGKYDKVRDMTDEEFDQWCIDNRISKQNKYRIKKTYRSLMEVKTVS